MADALLDARTLIGQISLEKDPAVGNLKYAGKLKTRQVPTNEVTWVDRAEDFNLAPITSGGQNSPIVPQGTYKQFKTAGIDVRFAKRFTEDELANIISPDTRYKVDALFHIKNEVADMMRRAMQTKEYIAHCAIARGAVKFVNNDPSSQMNLNITFPILTKTAGTLWSTAGSATPVANINTWLDNYEMANGKLPDLIRMSQAAWKAMKATTEFKAEFTSYLRTTGMDVGDIPSGLLTREMVAKALGWPPIELYTERFQVKFTAKNNETAASNVVIELVGENGFASTFGLNIGDKLLIGYDGEGSWTQEATISAVSEGVSVTATIASNITAGAVIVAKPNFFPDNKIILISDEGLIEEIQAPYGLITSGDSVAPANFYGLRAHVFENSEKNLVSFRRVWDRFGFRFSPKKVLSATVL